MPAEGAVVAAVGGVGDAGDVGGGGVAGAGGGDVGGGGAGGARRWGPGTSGSRRGRTLEDQISAPDSAARRLQPSRPPSRRWRGSWILTVESKFDTTAILET